MAPKSSKRCAASSSAAHVVDDGESKPKRIRTVSETETTAMSTTPSVIRFLSTSWSAIFDEFLMGKEGQLDTCVIPLIVDLFIHYGIPEAQRTEMINFVSQILRYYHQNVYHNATHALHVTINCAYFLSRIHRQHESSFGKVEKLALIFAALIHDAGHLGVPNIALIRKQHPFAIQYHDQSVAEMHSLTLGLTALEMGQHSLLSHFSVEERSRFRKYLIDLVLCTDIADGMKKKMLEDRLDLASLDNGQLNLHHVDGKSALLSLLLRTCDVGSGMQSLSTAEHWAMNFYLETKFGALQGDGLLPEAQKCYSGQIYYLEAHSLVLAKRLSRTAIIEESFTHELAQNISEHIRWWKLSGYDSISRWEDDERLKSLVAELSKKSAAERISQSSAITMASSTAVRTSNHGGRRTTTSKVSISVSQDEHSQSLQIVDEEIIMSQQSSSSSSSHRKKSKAVKSVSGTATAVDSGAASKEKESHIVPGEESVEETDEREEEFSPVQIMQRSHRTRSKSAEKPNSSKRYASRRRQVC